MADLAQLDLRAKGGEARLRALLEDLIEDHKGVYPHAQLALVVWFGKSPSETEHNLLELFAGLRPTNQIVVSGHQSIVWKTGTDESPFVNIHATSVDHFEEQLRFLQHQGSLRKLWFFWPEAFLRPFCTAFCQARKLTLRDGGDPSNSTPSRTSKLTSTSSTGGSEMSYQM